MRLTNKKLEQLIYESMDSPNEIKINKLVKLINSGESGLNQALELIKALELEAWNNGNLHSAIKAYSDKWQKEYDAEETYLRWLYYFSGLHHRGDPEVQPRWSYFLGDLRQNPRYSHLINNERLDNFHDLKWKIRDLKNFLKKFDTSNMLWLDDPLMENKLEQL